MIYSKYAFWSIGSSGPSFSADATAVLNRLPSLSFPQKQAVADFVDSQVLSGNWAKLDVFQFYGLGATEGLKDWLGTYNATNPNSYPFVTGGVEMPGGSSASGGIRTGYNPTTGANFQTRDAIFGVYCYSNDTVVDFRYLLGGLSAGQYIFQRTTANRLDFSLNGALRQITSYPNGFPVGLWSCKLIQSGANELSNPWFNGTNLGTGGAASAVEINQELIVGARGSIDVVWDGTLSCFYAGAGDGFDIADFSSNLDALIAALGL